MGREEEEGEEGGVYTCEVMTLRSLVRRESVLEEAFWPSTRGVGSLITLMEDEPAEGAGRWIISPVGKG